MDDHFARLTIPRRPWLDVEILKQRFHELSTEVHPDQSKNDSEKSKAALEQEFAEVNAAHQCLSNTKSRVRHLIELELGQAPENVQSIPAEMTDWFMEIGAICRKVDAFLTKKEQQNSPMLQAALMGEGMALNDEVAEMHQKLQAELAKIDDSLKALNPDWERLDGVIDGRAGKLPLAKLDALGQRLSFWVEWSAQLGERSTRLMF